MRSSPLSPSGAQRFSFALRLGPDRGDRDDLLVQACGAGAIDGEAPHQHEAGLRARPFDDRDARQARLEALRYEARQQAAHQAVLEMDLDHVGASRPSGRRGDSNAMARIGTILRHSLMRSPRLRGRTRRSSNASSQPASLAKAR